jgi:hypothetical protein
VTSVFDSLGVHANRDQHVTYLLDSLGLNADHDQPVASVFDSLGLHADKGQPVTSVLDSIGLHINRATRQNVQRTVGGSRLVCAVSLVLPPIDCMPVT